MRHYEVFFFNDPVTEKENININLSRAPFLTPHPAHVSFNVKQ